MTSLSASPSSSPTMGSSLASLPPTGKPVFGGKGEITSGTLVTTSPLGWFYHLWGITMPQSLSSPNTLVAGTVKHRPVPTSLVFFYFLSTSTALFITFITYSAFITIFDTSRPSKFPWSGVSSQDELSSRTRDSQLPPSWLWLEMIYKYKCIFKGIISLFMNF